VGIAKARGYSTPASISSRVSKPTCLGGGKSSLAERKEGVRSTTSNINVGAATHPDELMPARVVAPTRTVPGSARAVYVS